MNNYLPSARIWANILDNQFSIGSYRFGLDAFLDLLPIGGDTIVLILSMYLIWVGIQMKIPPRALYAMVATVLVSYLIGLIPILGDVAYIGIKPNMRNLAVLEKYATMPSIDIEP
jgi:hypothetical protein